MRLTAMTAGCLLVAAVANAQTPAAKAPAPSHAKRLFLATLAGVATGVAIGDRVSFGPGSTAGKMWHLRTGMSYGAVGGGIAAALSEMFTARHHDAGAFWWSKSSTPWLVGIAAVEALDYTSTRFFRARGRTEWLITNKLVDNKPAFIASEIGATLAGVGAAWVLHRTGHHTIERLLTIGHVGFGTFSGISNYHYGVTGHSLWGQ